MGWNDANELVVGGTGEAYVAPVGSTLPAKKPTDALDAAFFGLGYHTEDGASFSVTPDISEIGAWQSRQPIRRDLNGQDIMVSFVLQQWNEESVCLAFGGGEITEVESGIFRYDFPDESDVLDERALVLDVADGDDNLRFVFPRGNVTEAVETQFKRSEPAVLPITFKVLSPTDGGAPGYVLMDNAEAFAAGS
jgi:hypothetical protein